MGLLDRAAKFAEKAYNYVVDKYDSIQSTAETESKKDTKHTAKQSPNSVVRPDEKLISAPEDVVVKSTDNNKTKEVTEITKHAIVTQKDIDNKIKKIDEKCKQFNISYDECLENILSNMDFSLEEFNKLSNSQKMKKLNLIDSILSSYIADKYMYDPNVDISALIGQSAKNLELATDEGGIKNHKEFKKYTKKVNAQLIEDLTQAKTDEEKINIINEYRKEFRNNIEAERLEALKKCKTEADKNKINFIYDKRLEALESQNATEIIAKIGAKNAFLSTYFVGGKQYAIANKNSINLFNDRAKCTAANSYTHERRMKSLEHFYKAGDQISSDVFGEAVQYTTQFMSVDALEQYETDAYNFRLNHKDNLPEYITQEHLTAESAAIGSGAILNKNLTTEEKAQFLKNWNEHAQQFDDYDQVREKYYKNINEYIKEHPEAKQSIEEVKAKYREFYKDSPEVPKAAKKRYDSSNIDNGNDTKISESNLLAEKQKTKQINTSTPKDIAKAISDGEITVVDAIAEFHEKGYEAIFEDKDLFRRNGTIADIYINNNRNDLKKLLSLSNFFAAVELIVKNISPSIKSEYAQKVKLSSTERNAIFGKDNCYATT